MSGLSLAERIAARGLTGTVEALAQAYGVTSTDVLGRGRTKAVVRARTALMRSLRERGLSYPEIGHLLDRDHATVMYACGVGARAKTRPLLPVPLKHLGTLRVI